VKPIRVALAEDHPVTLLGLRAMVRSAPSLELVAEAKSGPEALSACRRLAPDVLLLDLALPGIDGLEVLTELQAVESPTRVIVLTSSLASEDVYRALRSGARAYLTKDVAPEALVRAIEEVVAGRRVVPPEIADRLAERLPASDLSPREKEVLAGIVDGLSNREIGERLGIGEGTVRTHVAHLLEKLGVADRTQAAVAAVRRGLVAR
jgi:DNA-binding NarL/FixJ family response regulator